MMEKTFYEFLNISPLAGIGACLEAVFLPQKHFFPSSLPELPPDPSIQEMWRKDWENLGKDMWLAIEKVTPDVQIRS